jgi:chemotaxis response regulator CheB
MPPRILIVDANARMRRTIRQVVEDSTDLQVCGEGTDGRDAIRKAEKLKPDLVVLDLTSPTG